MNYAFKDYDEAARAIHVFNRIYPAGYAYLTNAYVSNTGEFTLVIEDFYG